MKVGMDADEWYPVWTLSAEPKKYHYLIAEVDDDLWHEYEVVMAAFEALQEKLQDVADEARKAK